MILGTELKHFKTTINEIHRSLDIFQLRDFSPFFDTPHLGHEKRSFCLTLANSSVTRYSLFQYYNNIHESCQAEIVKMKFSATKVKFFKKSRAVFVVF